MKSPKKTSLAAAEGGGERTLAGVSLSDSLARLRRSLAVPKGPPVRKSGVSGRDYGQMFLTLTCVSVCLWVCSGLGISLGWTISHEISHMDVIWGRDADFLGWKSCSSRETPEMAGKLPKIDVFGE